MKLNRAERDYYRVSITVDPPLTGTWQASFDDGTTWIDGTTVDDDLVWLIAGPDFDAVAEGLDPDDTQATITGEVVPLFRLKDDPVLDVEKARGAIRLWGTPAEEI